MAGLRRLNTQTEAFWRDEYQVSDSDLDLITGMVLDAGKPQELRVLTSAIIMRRFRRESDAIARQADSGQVYQPMGTFKVGQDIVFTAFEYAVGHVTAVRDGYNPKYGNFAVISVAFEGQEPEREFAVKFAHPHPLNRPAEELLGGADSLLSETDMVRLFEHYVAVKLEAALKASDEYVFFSGRWFLQELLPDIHVGYLNLAEAMIDMAGHPLAAREMLGDLDLAAGGSEDAQLFALNHALGTDERFDNVSLGDEPVWYLRALEPDAVFARPAVLEPAFRAEGGEYLGLTLLDLVDEVGDELDDIETMVLREQTTLKFEVTFPHLHAGTMPATLHLLRQLPALPSKSHVPIMMTDVSSGRSFEAWVLPDERYVCGLGDWYASVGMMVGGQVTVTPASEPMAFTISVMPARGRRSEWVRSASAQEGALTLQMQRGTVGVRCDRNMLIDVPDPAAIETLMIAANDAQMTIGALVRTAFGELAKLSGRGMVHAKGIYSAVNLLRRTGTVPVFAELTRNACFDPVGDGFWAFDASLVGTIYRNAEDMRERPQSSREDIVKDQVVQYLGR